MADMVDDLVFLFHT